MASEKKQYKQITFAKGYSKSFADFTEEFSGTHVFKSMQPGVRELELKRAYKIAVKDGNSKKSVGKSKKHVYRASDKADI